MPPTHEKHILKSYIADTKPLQIGDSSSIPLNVNVQWNAHLLPINCPSDSSESILKMAGYKVLPG